MPVIKTLPWLLAAFLFVGGTASAQDSDTGREMPRVLVLYSYDAHHPLAEETLNALSKELVPYGYLYEIEYLNAVGNWSPRMEAVVRTYLAERLAHGPPYDLVIAFHNQAIKLLMADLDGILGSTPVLYGGIEDPELQHEVLTQENMTGVIGRSPLTLTGEAVVQLLPELSRLYIISDLELSTVYSQQQLQELEQALGPVELEEILLGNMRYSELISQLRELEPNSAVLPIEFRRDINWTRLPSLTALRLIVETAPVPVFSVLGADPQAGALGGAYLDPEALGRAVGVLARQALEAPHDALPEPVRIEPRYRFSRSALRGHAIAAGRLPAGSEVLPTLSSVLRENPHLLLGSSLTLIVLGFVVASLVVLVHHRGKRNAELRTAKEAAERSVRARSQFLANVSHELRTPLNGISGLTQVLKETELDEEQQTLLQMVESSTSDLTQLIDGLLDFENAESGRLKVASVPFSLLALAQETVRLTRIEAARKQLSVDYRFEFDPEHVFRGDPHKVKQILLNLVANAVKFTESGGVEIIVTELMQDAGKVWVDFHVNDNGPGIDEEELGRLFDVFHQANLSTGKKHGGLGMGLSLAKSLTTILGGEIAAVSTKNHGSSFRVRLPFSPEPE